MASSTIIAEDRLRDYNNLKSIKDTVRFHNSKRFGT